MILLENSHRIIQSTLKDLHSSNKGNYIDTKFADFGGITYHLISSPAKEDQSQIDIFLSINIPCYQQLVQYGALDIIKRDYSEFKLQSTPEEGYHLTLLYQVKKDVSSNTTGSGQHLSTYENAINKMAQLKKHLFSAPFIQAFEYTDKWQGKSPNEDDKSPLMTVKYRPNEVVYIQAHHDRVVIIFSIVFKDPTDMIIGKVFLQEFVDARKLPALQNAPQVLFSKEPPSDIASSESFLSQQSQSTSDLSGYVTFVLSPRHMTVGARRESSIGLIQTFRDYLHYHIKASKAYLHSRLRGRVVESLKLLNRAKPTVSVSTVGKKGITTRNMT